ncbi:DUF221-domain-containing protein [Zymoseptoria brevis]|uniref:DUF221-domain-containing protein n=1 Tax=Zymoseptoria brevis TaxID=1047168 RepID=A0A0F4GXW8_9PEZI|nr:DUF221-domain-containing protein [Zymoseptoria brevis]
MSSNQGSNRDGASSLSGLVSTLIPTFLISIVVVCAFLVLRSRFERVYHPRSFMATLYRNEQSPYPQKSMFGWTSEYKQLTDEFVLKHSSLDNYLWLRYFKILIIIAFVGCLITWPILFPINATGGGGQAGLNILSFSNVAKAPYFFAHAVVACLFLGFVMFVITRESIFYIHLRQAYLLSANMSSRISSKTVLFTNVPEEYRDEGKLRSVFQGVRQVWLGLEVKELEDSVDDRGKAANKLETSEIKMIQTHLKGLIKKDKKAAKKAKKNKEATPEETTTDVMEINKKDRPMHRLPKLKFLPIGKKVDSIDWSRGELSRLVPETARLQNDATSGKFNKAAACFIEFESVTAAQRSMSQAPKGVHVAEMAVAPDQVIWKNIGKSYSSRRTKKIIFTAIVWWLCIFWSIPVAVIGSISNIQSLTEKVPFLGFINSIPPVILGVVTGLLPVILLAVLMALVPIFCNIFARTFEVTQGAAQLRVQNWYFAFQVIQVFLITTFASGAAAVAQKIINDPSQAPGLLANNLPKASNFYISYFILFGLLSAALTLLNVAPLLILNILSKILDKTPRKLYNRYITLSGLGWGSLFPKFTNLGVIALAYSCIAPLVLGFATVGFTLLYLAFRYSALFTLGTDIDTKGACFARALRQLVVGIYLSEICLIGLFGINTGTDLVSIGPLVITVILLVLTIVWQVLLKRKMKKLMEELAMRDAPSNLTLEKGENGVDGHNGQQTHLGKDGYGKPDTTAPLDGQQAHIGKDGYDNSSHDTAVPQITPNSAPPKPTGMVGRVKAFFMPGKYATSDALSAYVIGDHLSTPVRPYTNTERQEAYLHPAVSEPAPVIWLAKDKLGLSQRAVQGIRKDVGEGLEATDEQAWFNEKAKVCWDNSDPTAAPIYEERVEY